MCSVFLETETISQKPGKLFSGGGAKREIVQWGAPNPKLCRRQGGGHHARADLGARAGGGGWGRGARIFDKNHPFAGFWHFARYWLCPRWTGERQLSSLHSEFTSKWFRQKGSSQITNTETGMLSQMITNQLQTANVVIKKMSIPPLVLLVHRSNHGADANDTEMLMILYLIEIFQSHFYNCSY